MPPTLPGFYYDAERKKYFKIQPNHTAAHASATNKYSEASVKKETDDQREQKRRKVHEQEERKTRLRRSGVLRSPLGGQCGLMREIGGRPSSSSSSFSESGTAVRAAWAMGLERRRVRSLSSPDVWGGEVGVFVFDEDTGVLTQAVQFGPNGNMMHVVPSLCDDDDDDLGRESWAAAGGVTRSQSFSSEITSMDISPSRVLMTTAMGGSHPACVHLTKLIDPEQWRLQSQGPFKDHNPLSSYTNDVSITIRSQRNATFWASSPRPDPTISDFALATSYGTVLVKESQSSWSFDRIQTFKRHDLDAGFEVLAVDWLDSHVLLNGCRDGAVKLWDARTRGVGGTSWRVKHPSCVNHVRRMDGNRIVVAGLQRRMAAYDLRYIRPVQDGPAGGVTRPFVEFPGYRNRELNGVAVGFDVCGELVAAGSDEGGVQIFDGASGREVRVGREGDMGKGVGGPARCLRFVEMEGKREGMRLFVADGKGIEQWAW